MQGFNPYEAMYMSRLGDHFAHTALFQWYDPRMQQEIAYTTKKYRPYKVYEKDFYQTACLCLQDVLMTYRNDQIASFSTYFNVLLKRGILDQLRKNTCKSKVNAHDVLPFSDDAGVHHHCGYFNQFQSPWMKQEFVLAYDRLLQQLETIVQGFSKREQQVFACWKKGMSYQEACEKLQINSSQYAGRLYRLKKKIKKHLRIT